MPLGDNMDLSEVLERKLEEALNPEEKLKMLTRIFLQLDASYRLQKQLNAMIDLDELFMEGMSTVADFLQITEYILMLNENGLLRPAAASRHWKEHLADVVIPVGDGLLGRIAQKGKLEIISDLGVIDDPRSIYFKSLKPLDLPKVRGSLLCLPVFNSEKNVSAILIVMKPEIDAFDDLSVSFFMDLANELGKTIARAKRYQNTKELAIIDETTGLPNRKNFLSNLDKELARATRYGHMLSIASIMWTGLEQKDKPNEYKKLVKAMSAHISKRFRKSDLTAKFDADSFAFIFPQTRKADAETVMQTLCEELKSFADKSKLYKSTFFYGLASYPEDGNVANALIEAVEKGLCDTRLSEAPPSPGIGPLGKYLKNI